MSFRHPDKFYTYEKWGHLQTREVVRGGSRVHCWKQDGGVAWHNRILVETACDLGCISFALEVPVLPSNKAITVRRCSWEGLRRIESQNRPILSFTPAMTHIASEEASGPTQEAKLR